MEGTILGITSGLTAPGSKSVIQERIGAVHGGLDANAAAIGQVQFNHRAAALNQVQLLVPAL